MDINNQPGKKYKTICFANQKGGVGKTTCAVNIAACLARSGKKVLLADNDPQGNATSGIGIDKRGNKLNIYDLYSGVSAPREIIVKSPVEGLYVLPSGIDLAGAELELADQSGREYKLKEGLEGLKDDFDYIIIDSPPSLGLLTINALTACDAVVVPLLCEFYSLEGLSQLTVTIKHVKRLFNADIELLGVLINMYDGRLNLTFQVLDEIKKYFAGKLFKTPVPRSVKISEAPGFGVPVTEYDRHSKGAAAYAAITREFISRCGE